MHIQHLGDRPLGFSCRWAGTAESTNVCECSRVGREEGLTLLCASPAALAQCCKQNVVLNFQPVEGVGWEVPSFWWGLVTSHGMKPALCSGVAQNGLSFRGDRSPPDMGLMVAALPCLPSQAVL